MCGIWSIIDKSNNQTTESLMKYLSDFWNIKHRGPDNSHLETFDNVYVGFHRLAVMDTSFKSNQPYVIRDNNRTIVFVCNGEIYNYTKITKEHNFDIGTSDCLVIPKLYIKITNNKDKNVDDWIKLFNNYITGEFSFIMFEFDEMMKLDKYFVGRDHVGVRPLYMCLNNDKMDYYSSELKGMLNYKDTCKEFPPGTIRSVKNNGFTYESIFTKYTDIYNKIAYYKDIGIENQLQIIRKAVINSVKRRLIADRPIAFLLSGGVDSSLVAALGAKIIGQPIRTFCCGMKGSTDMIYARKVADHIKSNHTEIYFTEEEGITALEDVIKTTETWDTTTIRASVGQYMVSKYIGTKTDCKVVMVGEGPDEVCSSYLFNYYAPDDESIENSSKEYVENIHMYDGRRADRCVSRWGLEARVPFLDPEFIRAYWKIDPKFRNPTFNNTEKYMLRKAFDNLDLLPDEILWRKKEAFSDGISSKERSWHNVLQDYISDNYDEDDNYENVINNQLHIKPVTKEAKFYRKIFLSIFGISKDDVLPKYWLPKWNKNGDIIYNYTDPSARDLEVYN
jgi:asparagine synthase (glutamine-hydrolysing)